MNKQFFPTNEGFVVMVRDRTMPKGKQAIVQDKYFSQANKVNAQAHYEACKRRYPHADVVLSECIY